MLELLRQNNLTTDNILEYCLDNSIVNISQLILGKCNHKIDWKRLENKPDLIVSSKRSLNNDSITIFINNSNGNQLRIIQNLNNVINNKFTIIIENKIPIDIELENDYEYDDHKKWMDEKKYQFEQILILKPKLLALINTKAEKKTNDYFCLINLDNDYFKCDFQ